MGVIADGVSSLTDLAAMVKGMKDRSVSSLTKFTKDANIIGRVYIEENIARDDVAVPLMGVLNQMYVSYILTALHLDQVIVGGRTVREVIGAVSSEGYVDAAEFIESCFGEDMMDKPMPSLEASLSKMEDDTQRLICGRLIELDLMGVFSVETTETSTANRLSRTTSEARGTSENKSTANGTSSKDSTTTGTSSSDTTSERMSEATTKDHNFKSSKTTMNENGEQHQTGSDKRTTSETSKDSRTTTTSGSDEKTTSTSGRDTTDSTKNQSAQKLQSFKAYIYVQMIPYILDAPTMHSFFDFNFLPGFLRRWKQMRAGEIKFFRDFIFAKDLIEKQRQKIKEDKSGILVDMMLRQKNKLATWVMRVAGLAPTNYNAASSIFVVSKQAFDAACANAHINFSSNATRQTFFSKTFTMMLLVVDPMYGTMELYLNGLDVVGKYTFDMINRVGAKGKDSFDLKQIMQSLNQGMTPKF